MKRPRLILISLVLGVLISVPLLSQVAARYNDNQILNAVFDSVRGLLNISISVGGDATIGHVNVNSANATTATQLVAKTASKSIYITGFIMSADVDMNIILQDDAGTPVVLYGPYYFVGEGGVPYTVSLSTPVQVATNQDLDFKTSAVGNVTVTVEYYIK